jgi:tetratricopeptide (TPR) repeat protein
MHLVAGDIYAKFGFMSLSRSSGAVLAIVGVLLAGCVKLPARKAPPAATASSPGSEPAAGPSEDQLAKAHAHYAAGVVHEVDEDLDAALEEYKLAALEDPDDESLVLEVSRRLMQNKETDEALEVVARAASRPKASGQIFARLALLYSELGKTDQAIAADRDAIRRSPDLFGAYQNLFLNYLQSKQPAEAVKVLDEASQRPEASAEFLVGVAELYSNAALQSPAEKSAAQAKALALLNRAAQMHPASPSVCLRLADAFNTLGESTKAARLYVDLLKQLPDMPLLRDRIHAKLADIYLRGKDPKQAGDQLEAIIRDDPTNPQANYYLGSILFDEKKLAEAADYFGKAILFKPDMQEAYFDLAQAQLAQDKPSEALATLEKARQKFPQSFILEYFTAVALTRQKAYTQALEHFTAAEVVAQATNPKLLTETFYFQFGAANERKGDYTQAEKYFQKCLQLQPDFAEALNYLGYMWAEHGLNLDQARGLIEKAVKIEPKNAAYLDSLAWVLFKLNQPKAALPYALEAAKLSDQPDATVYDHIGDIYASLNQLTDARAAWRKSLSLEPNEDVRKKLDSGEKK